MSTQFPDLESLWMALKYILNACTKAFYHAKSLLIGKDSDAGRDWGQEEKGTTEDEIAGWHHRLDGLKFE